LDDASIGFVFSAAMNESGTTFGDVSEDELVEDFPNDMLKLMAGADPRGYDGLFEDDGAAASVMVSSAERVVGSVAAQIATKTLRKAVNSTLIGQAELTRDRLHVSDLSLWVMFAGCVLVVFLIAMI
jgi:hypothetical protein